MRLRQLARKLDVNPNRILEILSENSYEVQNDPNLKLTEDQEVIVVQKLQPAVLHEESKTEIQTGPQQEELPLKEGKGTQMNESLQSAQSIEPTEKPLPRKIELPETKKREKPAIYTLEKEVEAQSKDLELIKAPKVKLDGLKVLGKIDLPEPKSKAKEKEETQEEESKLKTEKPTRNRRKSLDSRRKTNQHKPRLNPVEYERLKAEKEAKKLKEKRLKEIKLKKEQHYKEKVQAKVQAKTIRKKPKPMVKPVSESVNVKGDIPKTLKQSYNKPKGLKRLWAWLNGKYDQY